MLLTALALLSGPGGRGPVGSVQEKFPTWVAAHNARLVDRGLLPAFAPRSATEIVVRSLPESDLFRGSFRFPISDGRNMKTRLANMPAKESEGAHPRPEPYDPWWPTWLQGVLTAGPRDNPGYSLHRPIGNDGSVENLLVACNLTKGHCLYWSDSRGQ